MSKPNRCVHDVQNALGQSLPRNPDDAEAVFCAQESLRDLEGEVLPKNTRIVRGVVDEDDELYPTDGSGRQVVPRALTIQSPGGVPNPTVDSDADGGPDAWIICPPSADFLSPISGDPYRGAGTPVVHNAGTDTMRGAPEHHTICTRGVLAALPGAEGAQPWDFLVPEGDPLTEVANATFQVTNPTDRVMSFMHIIGVAISHRTLTDRANAAFTQGRYEISGIVGGPLTVLGSQEFQSGNGVTDDGGAVTTVALPALTPTTACWDLAPGATATIRVAVDQRVRQYDGESEIAVVNTRWLIYGSTKEA